jgi:pyruvate kinase
MKPKQPRHDPVLSLVRGVRGTAVRIAAACGVNRETVWNWQQVPAKHVLAVESVLDIPRHRIRPDLYPPPSDYRTRRWFISRNRRKQDGART